MKTIGSQNALEATQRAYDVLSSGGEPVDACVEGVSLVEDDPSDMTVGYGGLPNEEGVVELDAAVMNGPTHRVGAVAALRGIRHPVQVARLVMQQTNRVLLIGEGALAFARANGFAEENLLTEESCQRWMRWRRSRGGSDDWIEPTDDPSLGPVLPDFKRPTGTVYLGAVSTAGDLASATSTSGHAFKLPGRVGDSPIAGAGLYADNEIGCCGSIGWGEANQENLSSFAVVERLRSGAQPEDAGIEVLQRIVRHSPAHLCDAQGRPSFNVRLFVLTKDGRHAGVALWGPQKMAVTDADGSRLEPCKSLYERGDKAT